MENDATPLTPREQQILQLLAQRQSNAEIAEQLTISVRSVEKYRSSLGRKLGGSNREQLLSSARGQRLID